MDADAHLRVNVFDWEGKDGFPEIMKAGGFDAVVGNPPYVRIQTLPANEVGYLTLQYPSASTGNCDLYISFVERGYRLLKMDGQLGFIIPNKFLRTDYGVGVRRMIGSTNALKMLIDFGAEQVFNVTIYTCILILKKSKQQTMRYGISDANPQALEYLETREIPSSEFNENAWTLQPASERDLIVKITAISVRLLDLPASMGRGSSTGDDNVFVIEKGSIDLEAEALREPLFATDFGRYHFRPEGKWQVIFPYQFAGRSQLLAEDDLKRRWPKTYHYLKSNETALRKRKQYKEWYGYSAPRNLEVHERAHIAVPLLANRGLFSMITEQSRGNLCPMASGGFTITLGEEATVNNHYVLGLLNSKLLYWILRGISNIFRGGWITCTKQYFGELPIRVIDPTNKSDVAAHDRIVSLVEKMLDLHKQRAAARTPHEQTALDRQISATDIQIDRLVYDLYGLTEEEIKLVEGA
jgi:adenine-specific DNA-methyltransferase